MTSYPSLRDRVIVVTGGASGIGEAIVEAFAMQNSRVAFLDIQDAAADLLVHRIEAACFTPPVYFHCDLSDIAAIKASVENILERFNTVDVLVNNAGNDSRHSIEEVTPRYWDQAMAVNLKHQFFMAQAVIPSMRQENRGSIINMSSISWAIPSTGLPVNVTAKAAVVGLTRTLAHELEPVNDFS
jgi:NAD(P)-dependent dehydrogenase (short-subunit alcohol dehydrogenase family)